MKGYFYLLVGTLFSSVQLLSAQQLNFNHIIGGESSDQFLSLAQDKYGFMWFGRQLGGLQRYDGVNLKSYLNDPENSNSIASNWVECLVIDRDNIFWIGTYGGGLDKFDPRTDSFVHFKNNNNDPASLSNNTITSLYLDRGGNLWVGSLGGLDLLDKQTGKFKHFQHNSEDPESLSYNEVRVIYEDRSGDIWVGCGRPFINLDQKPTDGGLNRLNKSTGKFTRYKHDPADPTSIASNKVRAIFEDSKGNFWIGTREDGLHTLDRSTGKFTHYYYDPLRPDKLSRPPQLYFDKVAADHIAFITEDHIGNLIIASHLQGINYYNTRDRKTTHYGFIFDGQEEIIKADTATGLNDFRLWKVFKSREGDIWIQAFGKIFTIKPPQVQFPFHVLNENKPDANSIFCSPDGTTLWIGTDHGLFRKNMVTNEQVHYKKDPQNSNSLCSDTVNSVKGDNEGRIWMGTNHGLCRFDPLTKTFTTWYHNDKDSESLSTDVIYTLLIDTDKKIWIGTGGNGMDKFNPETGKFINYKNDDKNRNSLSGNEVSSLSRDFDNNLWVATFYGLNQLNLLTGDIKRYFVNSVVSSVFTDKSGMVWVSIPSAIYRFDKKHQIFEQFDNRNRREEIKNVINIIEDLNQNLWLSTSTNIIKINKSRDQVRKFDSTHAVHLNNFTFADNCISPSGEVFLGDQDGYYAFNPDSIKDQMPAPGVNFTSFKIGEIEVKPGKHQALDSVILEEREIKLAYDQNNFSIEFTALNYSDGGSNKFLYKLDNLDGDWRYAGTENKAYFFNIEPGQYILHVRGIQKNGIVGERSVTIIISPPWWRTWWAYIVFATLFISVIAGYIRYRSRKLRSLNKILEEKINQRTLEIQHQKEKVEITLSELKSTQSQLIQSEKMASLGELTAGIAHEIQNPLNFVNNFSEVNKELLAELNEEIEKGNFKEVKTIAADIIENEEKISHHGKRADSIVKGMLQHSRTNSGEKEPTDINALAEEYLRLAYQGLRAKDKTFNTQFSTSFDPAIGKVNIVPQDISRVLLNLYNNAFYAVHARDREISQLIINKSATADALTEKQKTADGRDAMHGVSTTESYHPQVSVSTKKNGNYIEITVKDNGNGISQKIADKIFQPFFTTKPTGQGTGLGLSLSYDIIKAHGGEIKVTSREGLGSEFIIILNAN